MKGISLFIAGYVNEPATMDVYRGKTTMQYTYRDSVKADSVVIFKKERK